MIQTLLVVAIEIGLLVGVVVAFNLFVAIMRNPQAPSWMMGQVFGSAMGLFFTAALFGSLALLTIGLIGAGVPPMYAWMSAAVGGGLLMVGAWKLLGMRSRIDKATATQAPQ